ncbi:ankyrin repeat-containing domain protein [Trichophaea hybrida]|nr:ankyrin repeat-containing domain protein [Trichophaea hybrida]
MQGFCTFSSQTRSSHDSGPALLSYVQPQLDFPLPETLQVELGPQSPSALPSTIPNRRKKQARRCWHCTNDRRKCEPSSDTSSCQRCKTIGYTCLLDAPGESKRRKLSRWKCQQCREKKQKCEPDERRWPGERCRLCIMQDLPCSEPQLATARQKKKATACNSLGRYQIPTNENPLESPVELLAVHCMIPNCGATPPPAVLTNSTPEYFVSEQTAMAIISQTTQRTGTDYSLNSTRNFNDVRSYVERYKEEDQCPEWVLPVCIKRLYFARSIQPGSLSSHDLDTVEKAAAILASEKRFAEAEKLYRRMISVRDLDPSMHHHHPMEKPDKLSSKFAAMLTDIGDYDAAIEVYEHSIRYWTCQRIWFLGCFDEREIDGAVKSLLDLYHQCHTHFRIGDFNNEVGLVSRILPLHRAIELECPSLIQAVLNNLPEFQHNIDAKNNKGQTALHLIAKSKKEFGIYYAGIILDHGADLEARDGCERTPLFVAAYNDTAATAGFFLDRGADITVKASIHCYWEDGTEVLFNLDPTPLHVAIINGHSKTPLRMLSRISNITDIPAPEEALVCASIKGLYDVVALLVDMGLDVNSSSNIKYSLRGVTMEVECALVGSVCGGYRYLSSFLLEKGARIESVRPGGLSALWVAVEKEREDLVDLLLARGADPDDFHYCGDLYPETSLQHACRRGWIDGVRRLIAKGAALTRKAHEKSGRTALQAACGSGHEPIVKMLLDFGADVNDPPAQEFGRTALQAACEMGHNSIVFELLHHGADVNANAAPIGGINALQTACEKGHESIVHELLDRGVNVNTPPAPGSSGRTALHAACLAGHESIVKMLLDCGADVNEPPTQEFRRTPLQAACEAGHESLATMLLQHDANVNAPPALSGGRTALQAACERGHESLVTILLRHGADVNVPSSPENGLSAIDAARQHDKWYKPTTIVKILVDAGAIG